MNPRKDTHCDTAQRCDSAILPSMPSSAARTAKAKTLTKREVIEFLGKSKRTIEMYIHDGRLPCRYFNGPNGKTAVFDRAAVEALKLDLDTPTVRAVADMRGAALQAVPLHLRDMVESRAAVRQVMNPDPVALLTAAIARMAPPPAPVVKPWLTLSEAVDYSGLPATYLVHEARARKIRAVNVGTGAKEFWRFNREGLTK